MTFWVICALSVSAVLVMGAIIVVSTWELIQEWRYDQVFKQELAKAKSGKKSTKIRSIRKSG